MQRRYPVVWSRFLLPQYWPVWFLVAFAAYLAGYGLYRIVRPSRYAARDYVGDLSTIVVDVETSPNLTLFVSTGLPLLSPNAPGYVKDE